VLGAVNNYLYMSTGDCTGEVDQKRDFIYFNLKRLGEPDVERFNTQLAVLQWL